MARLNSHLERILGRIDNLDSVNLTILAKRLIRERHLLESVFNTIREGVIVIDAQGTIAYANQSAVHLLGIKLSEVGNEVIWKHFPELQQTFDGVEMVDGVSLASHEIEITYPEHRLIRLYRVAIDYDRSEEEPDQQRHWALILSDVTQQHVSTQELLEHERTATIFKLAAGVAHEIGNPLNSINIHLQLMKRQMEKSKVISKEDEKMEKSLDACMSEVKRLDGIISHFLNAIKPRPLDLEDLNLCEVLAEVLSFLKEELEDLKIKVALEFDKELPIVLGDRNQIKQVFFNVFKNAMEAMDSGGTITITFRNDDNDVYIDMLDTGVGISEEDLAHIFEPYYSTKETGHGLGMMVVQRILRAHGGKIAVKSETGKGTMVTLQFPQKHRRVRLLTQEK